jgi:hypothetical protein
MIKSNTTHIIAQPKLNALINIPRSVRDSPGGLKLHR